MRKSRQRPLTPLLFGMRTSHWLAIPCCVLGLPLTALQRSDDAILKAMTAGSVARRLYRG